MGKIKVQMIGGPKRPHVYLRLRLHNNVFHRKNVTENWLKVKFRFGQAGRKRKEGNMAVRGLQQKGKIAFSLFFPFQITFAGTSFPSSALHPEDAQLLPVKPSHRQLYHVKCSPKIFAHCLMPILGCRGKYN